MYRQESGKKPAYSHLGPVGVRVRVLDPLAVKDTYGGGGIASKNTKLRKKKKYGGKR